MTPAPDDSDGDGDLRVLVAAREYLGELEAGRVPDRGVYFARHPELESVLAEHFDGIELAHAAGQALRPTPPAPIPNRVDHPAEPLGDFRILREVGRGGMGVVYEAVQLSLGRRVALKVLPFAAGLNSKQLQRFKTEAHAAAQLHHTNIVPVYAVGSERGVHFYAMQIIDGRPLDAVIREVRGDDPGPVDPAATVEFRAGPTDPATGVVVSGTRTGQNREWYRTAARIAEQVAAALDYAHEAGVVHRDIKPANLLLDPKGTVWITDFGLAQVSADAGMTQTGDVFGTLRYMSPEQAAGRRVDVDHRTDVYSLGATLYELLTLEPMFPGQDRPAILHQILHGEPQPLRKRDRSVPPELETIVLKAVAKTPADRYATAGEMAADLRRFLDGRPILARRPSLPDRARKWLRRHPGVVVTAVALLLVGVVGLGISTGLVAREQDRTQAALDQERQRAKEADHRFQLARRSADEMIRIGEEELTDHPGMQAARRRLLEAALSYYQEFIDLRKDDPDAQADLAVIRDRVRKVLDDLAILQGAGDPALLREPAVLDDLRLTPEQRKRMPDLFRRLSDQRQEAFREFYRLPAAERRKRDLDLARANEAAVVEVLTPDQVHRVRQIALQTQGPMTFRDPTTAGDLRLTADQRSRIRGIEADLFVPRPWGDRPGGDRPNGDRPGGDRTGGDRPDGPGRGPRGGGPGPDFQAAVEKILALLTDDQRARWKELTGPPYTGPVPRQMFGPGPRR